MHHHRTTRRVWCEAFAPFRKPDAPNRIRPDAKKRTQPDASVRTRPDASGRTKWTRPDAQNRRVRRGVCLCTTGRLLGCVVRSLRTTADAGRVRARPDASGRKKWGRSRTRPSGDRFRARRWRKMPQRDLHKSTGSQVPKSGRVRTRTRPDAKYGVAAGRVRRASGFAHGGGEKCPSVTKTGATGSPSAQVPQVHKNRGKLPRGVCLCTAKSTKSTKSRADGGEIARCGPLHHHRTIRRLWCAAFAPFRKPDAPNRTRPDASGRTAASGRVRTDGCVRSVFK